MQEKKTINLKDSTQKIPRMQTRKNENINFKLKVHNK